MRETFEKLGKQTPVYMFGVIANRLAGFIMLPIYTSYLSTDDYGVLELLSLTVDLVGTIGMVGLAAGVFKFHAEYETPEEKRKVLSTAAIGIMVMTSLVALVGFTSASPINDLVLGDDGLPIYFRIFFIVYLFQQWEIVPMLLLRISDRPWTFVAVGLTKLVSMLSLNIWLVVYRDMGILGVLISNLATTVVTSVVLVTFLFRSVGIAFSRKIFRRMVSFGAPMMVWFLGNFVLVFSDRYFLNHYRGTSDVGLYSLAYRFTMLMSAMAYAPFHNVWDPHRFRLAKSGGADAGATFRSVFTYLNVGLGIVALGIALFTRDVIRIMADPEFHSAYQWVPILVFAQIVHHWVQFSNLGLLVKERTGILGGLAVVAVTVVLTLNFLLVPRYGIAGAALATLGAYGVRYLIVLASSQRFYRIDYDWPRIGLVYLIVAVVIAAKYAVVDISIIPSIAYGFALLAVALAALYRIVLAEDERALVRSAGPRAKAMWAQMRDRG